jgi:hypothetical protein
MLLEIYVGRATILQVFRTGRSLKLLYPSADLLPPLSVLRSAPERPILGCNSTAVPRLDNNAVPKLLHHISSEGGPISALNIYILASKQDPSLSGMSLFLHCPKKRVPHQGTERIRKERKIAMEWNDLPQISSMPLCI